MSEEDALLQRLISEQSGEWKVEVHYNHYGDRGVVDAVRETEHRVELYELKSASAVRNSTGANEILRQVNRHREYYFQDHPTRKKKLLRLIYPLSQTSWDHIKENIQLYANLRERSIGEEVPCLVEIHNEGRMIQPAHPKIGYHTERWDEQRGHHYFCFFEVGGVEL